MLGLYHMRGLYHVRGFAMLVFCALAGGCFAANKRPYPFSKHTSTSEKQACVCSHISNSAPGVTSMDMSDLGGPVMAAGPSNSAHGSEASAGVDKASARVGEASAGVSEASTLVSEVSAGVNGASAKGNSDCASTPLNFPADLLDGTYYGRRMLWRLIASLCQGTVSDENAEIAVKALEQTLEADGSTPEGRDFLGAVLKELVIKSAEQREGRTEFPNFESVSWDLLERVRKLPTCQCQEAVWRRIFQDQAVDAALDDLATSEFQLLMNTIASDVPEGLADRPARTARPPSAGNDDGPGIDAVPGTAADAGPGTGPSTGIGPLAWTENEQGCVGTPFYSLKAAFGFSQIHTPGSDPRRFLRSLKGREELCVIMSLLGSNPNLRLQVLAVSQTYGTVFPILEDPWKCVFYGTAFEGLGHEDGEFVERAALCHEKILEYECDRTLTKISPAALGALLADCVRNLAVLIGDLSRSLRVYFATTQDDAKHFLAAVVESASGLSADALHTGGGYKGLCERILMQLHKPECKTTVFRVRSLPFTLRHAAWVGYFKCPDFDSLFYGLENRAASRVFRNHQNEEAKSE